MKNLLVTACLLVVFCAPAVAQTNPPADPPACGIGHTDVTTGEFICDDESASSAGGSTQVTGIGHTDAPEQQASSGGTTALTLLLDGASMLLGITGY